MQQLLAHELLGWSLAAHVQPHGPFTETLNTNTTVVINIILRSPQIQSRRVPPREKLVSANASSPVLRQKNEKNPSALDGGKASYGSSREGGCGATYCRKCRNSARRFGNVACHLEGKASVHFIFLVFAINFPLECYSTS
jgi:hypothetical protein